MTTKTELEKENQELKSQCEELQAQLKSLQDTMVVYQTSHGLFIKPLMDMVSNRRLLTQEDTNYTVPLEEIQVTVAAIVDANLTNPDYTDSEKDLFSQIKIFVCDAKKLEEPLIQRV